MIEKGRKHWPHHKTDSNISLTPMLVFTMYSVLLFSSLPSHDFSWIFDKGLWMNPTFVVSLFRKCWGMHLRNINRWLTLYESTFKFLRQVPVSKFCYDSWYFWKFRFFWSVGSFYFFNKVCHLKFWQYFNYFFDKNFFILIPRFFVTLLLEWNVLKN